MEQPQSGYHPISLPQDQWNPEPLPGYWTGSGKAIWAAIIAIGFGTFLLSIVVIELAKLDLSGIPLWRYIFVIVPASTLAALIVGAVLLLCRLKAGKIVLLSASGLMILQIVIANFRTTDSVAVRVVILILFCLPVLISAALTASTSVRTWLAKP
ncbi:hypothetical protein [Nocardia sp. NPDC056100]|uniref:hypothetical protein n=1 Tax=Nocardia sp. NPDC056100 TaxID=3345712 RepID=UPI0035DE4573